MPGGIFNNRGGSFCWSPYSNLISLVGSSDRSHILFGGGGVDTQPD